MKKNTNLTICKWLLTHQEPTTIHSGEAIWCTSWTQNVLYRVLQISIDMTILYSAHRGGGGLRPCPWAILTFIGTFLVFPVKVWTRLVISNPFVSAHSRFVLKTAIGCTLHTLSTFFDDPLGYVTSHSRQCIALFVVTEGLLDIGWYVLILYCYEKDFMSNPHKSKTLDPVNLFNASRHLDDILTIENPEFKKKNISLIYIHQNRSRTKQIHVT